MDEYLQYLEEKKNKDRLYFKFADKIKPVYVLVFIALFLIGNYLSKTENSKFVWMVLGGLVILFLFSLYRSASKDEAIPRGIAQEIAKHDLIKEIQMGRAFTHGTTVIPTSFYKAQTWDGGTGEGPKLFKYHFGFLIKETGKPPREIRYMMNPFSALPMGIVDCPLGFSGEDVKDIKLVFPETIPVKDSQPKTL